MQIFSLPSTFKLRRSCLYAFHLTKPLSLFNRIALAFPSINSEAIRISNLERKHVKNLYFFFLKSLGWVIREDAWRAQSCVCFFPVIRLMIRLVKKQQQQKPL